MTRYDETSGPGIGATLKDARRRLGMDIKEAEERTKIRTRYLRALEAEDWEVLPAPAYVRGFLRTYGQILGLDGEVLADRYRRSYEEPVAAGPAPGEPVLSNRRAPGSRPSVAERPDHGGRRRDRGAARRPGDHRPRLGRRRRPGPAAGRRAAPPSTTASKQKGDGKSEDCLRAASSRST